MAQQQSGQDTTAAGSAVEAAAKTPAQLAQAMVAGMTAKAALPLGRMFLLAMLAGAFIALGAQAANVAAHTISAVGLQRLVMGCVFPVGLIMVVLLGAELFTGNCMMLAALAAKEVSVGKLLRSWVVVYVGNLVGALCIVALVNATGQLGYSDAGLAVLTIKIAATKCGLTPLAACCGGILCNVLVCIAVLLAMAARDVGGKVLGIWFPVMAFVLSGFEHSIANMYYIPAGLLALSNPAYAAAAEAAGVATEALTLSGMAGNLCFVTLGNIIGGALVALVLWYCHGKRPSA